MTRDIPGAWKLAGFKKGFDIHKDASVSMSASRKQARPDVRELDECAISKTAGNVNTNIGDPVRALTFTALNQNFLEKDLLFLLL